MNDQVLSFDLVDILKADADLTTALGVVDPPAIFVGQNAEVNVPPSVTIFGDEFNMSGVNGKFRRGKLHITLRSRAGDEGADPNNHYYRFMAIWRTFFGLAVDGDEEATAENAAQAKADLKATILAAGNCELIEYGPIANAVEATTDGTDLKTVLTLIVAWRFL